MKIVNKTGYGNDTRLYLEDGTDITEDLAVKEVTLKISAVGAIMATLECYTGSFEVGGVVNRVGYDTKDRSKINRTYIDDYAKYFTKKAKPKQIAPKVTRSWINSAYILANHNYFMKRGKFVLQD